MESRHNPMASAAYMLIASAVFAGVTLLAKVVGRDTLGDPLHPLQISQGRFLFAFIAIATTAATVRQKITVPNIALHTARSVAGWGGISLMFAAVAFIPLADATAISFLNPVFAMILAIPLLGERVGPVRWLAAAMAVAGAVILIRPGAGSFQPGALLALAAAVIIGFEIILIKRLTGREAPLQILLFNNAIGLTIATIAVVFVWQPPTGAQWVALAALGGLMAGGQALFILAMQRADASFAVPFSYAILIFAGIFDFAIFKVVPSFTTLAGATIIICGALLLVIGDEHNTKPRA